MYAVEVITLTVLVKAVSGSIGGLTYMDPLNLIPLPPKTYPRGKDPCHPLYWYPRQIPDYCYARTAVPPLMPPPPPLPPPPPPPVLPPSPMPIPMPMPVFIPMPGSPPMPGSQPMPGPYPGAIPIPQPLPMAMPEYATFVGPGLPYPGTVQTGLVPGVDGLVSSDGAINILPFSDAYSDLLEKHKQKMIRIKLQNLLDEYERFNRRKCRRNSCS